MTSRFTISLHELYFNARIGVFPQERTVGNEFTVSLNVHFPAPESFDDDSLDKLVSYACLYEIVSEEMKRGAKLLETVASRIARRVLDEHSIIESGTVSISKLRPPIAGMDGAAIVTLDFAR